jgi:hypothetical protein
MPNRSITAKLEDGRTRKYDSSQFFFGVLSMEQVFKCIISAQMRYLNTTACK